MSDEHDDDLAAIGAPPRMSKRTLVIAALVGVIAGLLVAGSAYYRQTQDAAQVEAEAAP